MPDRLVGVTDQASGAGIADVRVRERTVNAVTVGEQYVIPIKERVPTFIGMVPTFRTLGTAAAAPHWVATVENQTGSARLVLVRQVVFYMDSTAATTTPNPIATLCRPTGTIAGGTTLTKTSVGVGTDTADTSATQVVLRGATASDGGVATAITGLTLANRMWRTTGMRLHTAAGQSGGFGKDLVPPALRDHGIVLRAGEQLGVALEYAAAADSPATMHYMIDVLFEEYTLP